MRPDWRPGNQRPSREKVGPVAAPNARRWVKAILHRPPATEPTNWLSKRVLPFSPFSFSFFLSFYFFGSLGFFFSSCSFSTSPLETRNSKRTFSRRPRQTGLAAGIRTVLFAFFFLFFFLVLFRFRFYWVTRIFWPRDGAASLRFGRWVGNFRLFIFLFLLRHDRCWPTLPDSRGLSLANETS